MPDTSFVQCSEEQILRGFHNCPPSDTTPESATNDDDPKLKANLPVHSPTLVANTSTLGREEAPVAIASSVPSGMNAPRPSTTRPPPSGGTVAESSSPSPISPSHGSQGVSKGAVAGIAISTAIISAAIALLAAYFLLKRRKRTINDPYGDESHDYGSNLNMKNTPYVQVSQSAAPLPGVAASTVPARQDVDLANLSNSSDFLATTLPPASEEHTVKTKVAALFGRFQRHVDSYYRDVHNTMTPTMATDLARFGSDLVEILESSSFPTVAVKHALAGYILSIVSPEAEDQATLFPAEVAGLKENERSSNPESQAAYILYKRLAVHLHSPNAASLQSRQADIREAAEHFALTFFPWANPTFHEQEKDEELVQIISDALNVSVWLYGEPYMYEFVWENTGRRGTVVTPGLVRLTDEKGRMMGTPRVLLEPTVASS